LVVETDAPATVRMPRSTRTLLATLTRVYQGNRHLRGSAPEIARSTTGTTAVELMSLARSPRWVPSVAVYASLVVVARLWSVIGPRRWHRDTAARLEVGR
jgi:hypothetical protein